MLPTESDKPAKDVKIEDCGQLTGDDAVAATVKAPDSLGDTYEDFPEDMGEQLDAARLLKIAADCKAYGNAAFKAGDLVVGLDKYQKGLRYLNEDLGAKEVTDDARAEMDALRFSLNSNAALLNIKLQAWDDAIHSADAALAVPGAKGAEKSKALYRRGLAYVRLKDEEAAIKDLEEAHKLVPGDQVVLKELNSVKQKAAARTAKEKAAYKKFFS